MRVLIVKPSSLGDVVHALPVLRLLRSHQPTASVDWWLSPGLFPLLERDPDIDRLIPFHKRALRPGFAALRQVRARRYDLIIDLQGLARSGVMTWLAGGARSIGLDLGREGARAFYDEAIPRPASDAHAVDWYLEVARRLGIDTRRSFDWLPRPEGELPAREHEEHIALIPGARWLNKRWPAEHFRQLVKSLLATQPELRFAVYGDAGDRPLAREITAARPDRVADRTGATSLPELMDRLRSARVVVTNDTGPMHIAAALGRPVIGLFGPTDARLTGPYGSTASILSVDLPCTPCLKSTCRWAVPRQCLVDLHPEAVAEAVFNRLRR